MRGREVLPEIKPSWGRPRLIAMTSIACASVIVGTWLIYQPLRSEQLQDTATKQLEQDNLTGAAKTTGKAIKATPLSPEPYWLLATIETARNNRGAAEKALVKATKLEPT